MNSDRPKLRRRAVFHCILTALTVLGCGGEEPSPRTGKAPPIATADVRVDQRIHLMKFGTTGRFGTRVNKSLVRIIEDQREAILLAPQKRVVFRDVPLYADARLEVAIGIAWLEWPKLQAPVRFRAWVRTATGENRLVFEEALDPKSEPSHRAWLERSIPLGVGTEKGELTEITLEATGTGTERLAAWSRPVVVSRGRAAESSGVPLVAEEVVRDLLGEDSEAGIERPDVEIFGLEIPSELGVIPSLNMRPGSEASWELTELPKDGLIWITIFLAGRTKEVSGELRFDLELEGATQQVALMQTRFDLAELDRSEFGVRAYDAEIPIPADTPLPAQLRFRVGGQVERGGVMTGLSRLQVISSRSIPRLKPREKPNVIVLLIDTLRADHLGSYGYERATSPELDALAQRGFLFESCIAQSSWTLPSTASVLTGLYPQTHGCVSLSTLRLARPLSTLPEVLLEEGFATGGFIANCIISQRNGFAQGFEQFQELCMLPAEDINAEAVDWIQAQGESPFFAYVHYYDPHWPYAAPEPFTRFFEEEGDPQAGDDRMRQALTAVARSKSREGGSPAPRWEIVDSLENDFAIVDDDHFQLTDWLVSRWRNRYDAEIRYWDTALGRLVDRLDELGILDDTWLIVTADHGEAFGEHDYVGHGASLHGEQVHVPLIILPPGGRAGQRISSPVEQIDIAPTVLAALGLEADPRFVGRSLLPGQDLEATAAFSILNDFVEDDQAAVQFPEWKAIRTLESAQWQLYETTIDRAEVQDRAAEDGVPLRPIQTELNRWLERTPRSERSSGESLDAATEAMLRAMGYLGKSPKTHEKR